VTVRRARAADLEAVVELHRCAFGSDDVPRLVRDLWRSDVYVPELAFVAVEDDRVVGHVMNTWSGLEGSATRLLQLSPLGVLPERQGRGVGSALVRASLEGARRLGEPLLLVEGSPAYYGRFGFVRAHERGLVPPPEARYDWAFQVAVLDDRADLPRGRVTYSEPFRR
jgi:putative acetyltransferase